MRWLDVVGFAMGGLFRRPLRTLLTVLGLAVGSAAVMTVIALGGEGRVRVEDEIARLGVDKVWITAREASHAMSCADGDVVAARLNVPVCAGSSTIAAVQCGEKLTLATISGYNAAVSQVYPVSALQGRMLTAQEFDSGSHVCMVDEALAESLGGDAVGLWVQADGSRFRVVGMLTGLPAQTMGGGTGRLIVPLSSYQDAWGGPVTELTFSVPPGTSAKVLADAAVSALGGKDGYAALTLEEEIDAARQIVRIFMMVLACVAMVCMLTGAIGVMNVLLVSVQERKREIGLMKAVGATSMQVAALFLAEAAVYGVFGCLLGLAAGRFMIDACAAWIGIRGILTIGQALPVLAGAAACGVLFGVAPALRAAALSPVDALRQE